MQRLFEGGAYSNQLGQFRVGKQISNKKCVTVTFLLCFILYLSTISKYNPSGAYIRRGDLTAGCLRDLYFGGAYTQRGLFSEFFFRYAILNAE